MSRIMYRCIIWTFLFILMIPTASMSKQEKRIALVIGNGLYAQSPLLSPANDANNMAAALKQCNFNVLKEINADKQRILKTLRAFTQKASAFKGITLFYYAGHTVQLNGKNYLVPVDANVKSKEDIETQCINLSSIFEEMKSAYSVANIIILNAAHEKPFGRHFLPDVPGLADHEEPGFFIMYSASPGSVSEKSFERESIFNSHLVSSLLSPALEIREVFKSVQSAVFEETEEKQKPWFSVPFTGYVYLYYPKLQFLYFLRDVQHYNRQITTYKSPLEKQKAWLSLVESYPSWSSAIVSKDPVDIIARALDELTDEFFFEMTRLFNLSLKKRNPLGMEFVYVPPGSFIMGSPFDEPGRGKDERAYSVTISKGFFIQTTEVTQRQWHAVMGNNPSAFDDCGWECPVESISWYDVQDFIDRLNDIEAPRSYRLPTEAEWEYAARAGNQGWFCFGSDSNMLKDYAWYKDNSGGQTQPVAQKKPNQWGLYDVHGNVWELCQDWGGEYPKQAAVNPTGPRKGYFRIARGGSWFSAMLQARSANRFYVLPEDRNYTVGFRLIQNQLTK
ncbi:MAG: SUMF1/EgtB/PvdO family nonheme iron enzyme [Deltaproteobacteria bacterium]|nr:SUMF1/EgtB/PvdO family nonheme iron enzyme [Deltaproteobacteria bacterium]